MSKEALKTLRRAKKLIDTPDTWNEGDLAQTVEGEEISPRNIKAVSFCALGALRHANGPGEKVALKALRKAAAEELEDITGEKFPVDDSSIFEVNDCNGFAYVHNMFDRAIKIAKKL
jgi:hypothetical protein